MHGIVWTFQGVANWIKCKSTNIEVNSKTHHNASPAKHKAHPQPADAFNNNHRRQFYWIRFQPRQLTPGVWSQWLPIRSKPTWPWGTGAPAIYWHPRGPRAHRWVSTFEGTHPTLTPNLDKIDCGVQVSQNEPGKKDIPVDAEKILSLDGQVSLFFWPLRNWCIHNDIRIKSRSKWTALILTIPLISASKWGWGEWSANLKWSVL